MNEFVIGKVEGRIGHITLDRPEALNALNHDMCVTILNWVTRWRDDPNVDAVLIDSSSPRAFCAGGDIRDIWAANRDGKPRPRFYFDNEYRLNTAIHNYPKPYIALIDGITMGGGVGVSVHGRYRVVTENAMLALPETLIGLFPDIGMSYVLPRCPGETGMYLGLTGERIKAADLIYTGLATHAISSANLNEFRTRLIGGKNLESLLREIAISPGDAPLAKNRAAIDRAFSKNSIEEILQALQSEGSWGENVRKILNACSPTSLKVTFKELREGKKLDFVSCMRMEYRMVARFIDGHEFYEGVRAAVIDKDRKPKWRPAELSQVLESEVDAYFTSLGAEDFNP